MGLTSNRVRAYLMAHGIDLNELIKLVWRASKSPRPERCALILRMRSEGFTFEAIARHMATSRNNVKILEGRYLNALERQQVKDERA